MAVTPPTIGQTNWGPTLNTALETLDSEATGSLQPGTPAGGDLVGTLPNPSLAATANVESIIRANRLDQMANPSASVSMNGQKIINLANGTASTDAVNISQIPTTLPPSGTAGGDLLGTYPNPTLSGTANVESIIRANRLDQFAAPAATVSMGSQKITSLANGVASSDAAAFGQIPTTLPPTGSASGDLSGTYPNPTVTGTHLSSPLPINQGGTGANTASTALAALSGQPVSNVRTITTATVTAAAFDILECDTTTNSISVTMPSPVNGTRVTVKKMDSSANTITIVATVDGGANPTINYQFQAMDMIADGNNWLWISRPDITHVAGYPTVTDARYVLDGQVAGNDLSGNYPNPVVAKINGVSITGIPSTGYVPTATGSNTSTWQALPTATTSSTGIVRLAGDLAGTATAPQVTSTHLSAALPVNQGGTGSTTQNFVDLSTTQTVAGTKTFSTLPNIPGGQPVALDWNNVKAFGAKGDNTTNDTTAIQNALNAGGVTYFPAGQYRVNTLTIPEGAVIMGPSSGGFGIENADTQQAHITLIAGTNNNLFYVPVGNANIRISNIFLDGNKNNNTTGDVIHIDDTGTPEELGMHLDSVHIEAAPVYGVYVGAGRRALKAYQCQFLYANNANLRINGSDSTWVSCIVGSSGTDNIQVGASVTRIIGCDIYGATSAGINILTSIQQVMIANNGIDRNGTHGIFVSTSADAVTIIGNDFHSNSQTTNGGAHHITVTTTTGGVIVSDNVAGVDAGMTNAAGYFVFLNSATGTVRLSSNRILPNSTNLGLINSYSRAIIPSSRAQWLPVGAKAITMDRMTAQGANVAAPWTSGTLYMAGGCILPGGVPVSQIAVLFGSTAAVSPTHCWFALIDQSLNVLAVTNDNGTGTITTSGSLTLNLAATYTPAYDQAVYIGILIVASTMPSAIANVQSGTVTAVNPTMCGNSTTGLTTPLTVGTTVAAITATANNPYAWVI